MSQGSTRLCGFNDLDDPGARGFYLDTVAGELALFVVRRMGGVYAYRNRCPHTGATLEWMPHRFLDAEGEFLQCGLHGALFRIETGECLRGPCLGDSLGPLPVRVSNGQVYLLTDSVD